MEIIKCDRCKKIIKAKGKDKLMEKTSGNIRTSNPFEWINFDLCKKCSVELLRFIKKYLKKHE